MQLSDAGAGGGAPGGDGHGPEAELRQLRHHTKNTLQRIIGLLSEIPGLTDTPEGEQVARELEYRICLSAQISNALFGLTEAPGSMGERLRQLAGGMVEMMREPDQVIRTGVSVRGNCPEPVREAVIRCAHELVGNAVKHGIKGRPHGRVAVRLVTAGALTTLTVTDNGWGFDSPPHFGEGLTLARLFAERAGGSLELDGVDGTSATVTLPHDPVSA
ncbi:MAG TPA: ATP-binding protein [Rhodopila sp.]|nr:ATP-binding protein [Rhodopila sp.]